MRLRPVLFSCLLCGAFVFSTLAHSREAKAPVAPRSCLVVGITDGDTLTARCGQVGAYEQVRIRIAAIDAPEKAQPFGERSRQALARLCARENATVRQIDTDRYGRTVADVDCNGQDVGSAMVSGGWAWVYDYNRIATRRGGGLFKLQDAARTRHAGLWADADPVPPWDWRRDKREHAGSQRGAFPLF